MGVRPNNLYNWARQSDERAPQFSTPADLAAELAALRRENEQLRQQRDILKKVGHPLRTPDERYERIHEMKEEHSVQTLCESFEVSRSGYYNCCQRQDEPGPRALEGAALRSQIAAIYQEHAGTYGSPRICRQLATSRSKSHRPPHARAGFVRPAESAL